jgi:HD-like signal output (HDOD) protein
MTRPDNTIYLNTRDAKSVLEQAMEPGLRHRSIDELRDRVKSLETLPPLPGTAHAIMEIYQDPYADAAKLAAIVETDPALCAQLLRWANSPLYGFQGRITTVKKAITQVLGFDLVMNLALGLASVKALKIEGSGPLGLANFWNNALFSASLCRELAVASRMESRPNKGTAYVSGLLHNLGLLVFGHLLPEEHRHVNQLMMANPDIPLSRLGEFALGISPMTLGLWILEAWDLPEVLVTAMAQQCNPEFRGKHASYANLVYISECLLKRRQLSLFHTDKIPPALLEHLGLTIETVARSLSRVLAHKQEYAQFASSLSH